MDNHSKTKELIAAATHLSAEDRAVLVDSLLKTLDPPDSGLDQQWLALAQQRLQSIERGEATLIPAETVFSKLKDKLQK